jgi:hypothetical protein
MKYKLHLFILLIGIILLRIESIKAQKPNKFPKFPHGTTPILTDSKITELKKYLTSERWDSVRDIYFESTNDKSLPDLICYIDSAQKVRIGLTTKNKANNPNLYGEKRMWVFVFSDLDLNNNALSKIYSRSKQIYFDKIDTTKISIHHDTSEIFIISKYKNSNNDDTTRILNVSTTKVHIGQNDTAFKIRNEPLQFEPEPSDLTITGIINLITKLLVGSSITSYAKTGVKDTVEFLKLRKIGGESNNDSIYYGMTYFNLALNSVNRIIIEPLEENKAIQFHNIVYNFGNFEASRLGAGFGTGFNVWGRVSDSISNTLKLYLFGYLYMLRPKLPLKRFNLALTVGTNIPTANSSILHDLILGVRFGFLGQMGMVLGANYLYYDNDRIRRTNLFFGIDYKL